MIVPRDLTLPEPGSTTARDVLSLAIGRLLADLREVLRRPIADPAQKADVRAVAAQLAATPHREAMLGSILRKPNVGALVRCARTQPSAQLVSELVATIAVELAVLGATTPVTLRSPPAKVVSLGGRFVLEPPVGPMRIDADLAGRAAHHVIDRDIVLALEDNNPLSMLEAHPKKSGNRIDLGGRSVDEWTASARDALARVERYLPDVRAEMDLYVQQLVPVGFDAESHLSASYREAIGTIYLTLHPHAMTMTEAIIHEFSHNKLNALFEIDTVLHNAFSPLFKSPVRPDPRPLHGVLLAVHAFVPVARLYQLMREAGDPLSQHPGFAARADEINAGNHEGIEVLRRHAEPTDAGRALIEELSRWDRHFSP